jgi:hypothetical protein
VLRAKAVVLTWLAFHHDVEPRSPLFAAAVPIFVPRPCDVVWVVAALLPTFAAKAALLPLSLVAAGPLSPAS